MEIIRLDYETNRIRMVQDENGELLWVAKDICTVLEHTNTNVALKMLDDDEKGVRKVYTLGGEQTLSVVNESGLYTLILRSNKPEAKKFRRWVTKEVLPSIRKTGSYSIHQKQEENYIKSLRDNAEIAKLKDEIEEIKSRKIVRELKTQLECAKLLGRSFDVNQYINNKIATIEDKEIVEKVKTIVGSNLKEYGGIELPHKPMTRLLKKYNINERVNIFNDYLEEMGILDNRVVTDYGKRFGFNMLIGDKTYPRWYEERFPELLTLMSNEGYIDNFYKET